MSEDEDLFEDLDVGFDPYARDELEPENLRARQELVSNLRELHAQAREVLGGEWVFETEMGGLWWDVKARYREDSGVLTIKGRADGGITVQYTTNSVDSIGEDIYREVEFLNDEIGSYVGSISEIDDECSGLIADIHDVDSIEEDSVEERYLRDLIGLFAGADRTAYNPTEPNDGWYSEHGDGWM